MARVAAILMYGLGGRAWSAGIADKLGPKLRVLPNVFCPPTYHWTDWPKIVDAIHGQPSGMKIVVAGHSMGANEIPNVAAAIAPLVLDLAIGYDPTIWFPCAALTPNVRKAICFHSVNWLNPIGHAIFSAVDPRRTMLTTYDTPDLHTDIDDDDGLHGIVVSAIKTLLG